MQLTHDQEASILTLARQTIRAALGIGVAPAGDEPHLAMTAGCFVTLHERDTHRLRGCIGTLLSNQRLSQTVREMARAVLGDPRFTEDRVTADELPRVDLEISVVSPLKPAATPSEFDLLNDGIYLAVENRTGVFLPQVARETGWTKEQLLARLCTEKLGLSSFAWRRPDAKLSTFTTTQIGPVPFDP